MRHIKVLMVLVALIVSFFLAVEVDAGGRKQKIPAPVPQTGQTDFYYSGDDGDLQAGVPWPVPRFVDNANGTVTDKLTGLIWLKDANCFGPRTWADALDVSSTLASGVCNLTDDSQTGDWRLPNIKELQSLIHYGVADPALPNTNGTEQWVEGDPFTGVLPSGYYWASSTVAGSGDAYTLYTGAGFVGQLSKLHFGYFVWPVRGGN